VDFIKCDTEGYEVEMLQGTKRTLKDQRPELLVEIHTLANKTRVNHLLEPLYDLVQIPHPHPGVHEGHCWIAARRRLG
jgi:hypothetical protein